MAAGTWTFTNTGRGYLIDGTTAIGSDTYKIALFTSSSNLGASTTTYSGVTNEVGISNTGYSTGGASTTLSKTGTSTVIVTFTSVTWTAGSANLTAKFAAIYEVSGNILCYCTLDSGGNDVTTTSGNTLTISPNAVYGAFTLA